MVIPPNKKDIVNRADRDVIKIQKQYMDGLITDGERYNKVIDIWAQATEKIAAEMLGGIGTEEVEMPDGSKRKGREFQPHLHDGRFGRERQCCPDPATGRYERPDGETLRRDY